MTEWKSTKCNSVREKLSDSQPNELKSARKNESGITLRQ